MNPETIQGADFLQRAKKLQDLSNEFSRVPSQLDDHLVFFNFLHLKIGLQNQLLQILDGERAFLYALSVVSLIVARESLQLLLETLHFLEQRIQRSELLFHVDREELVEEPESDYRFGIQLPVLLEVGGSVALLEGCGLQLFLLLLLDYLLLYYFLDFLIHFLVFVLEEGIQTLLLFLRYFGLQLLHVEVELLLRPPVRLDLDVQLSERKGVPSPQRRNWLSHLL